MLERVYVCTHALERWRERASKYADAPEEDVIEHLKQSRKVANDEFIPLMYRKSNSHYYHNEAVDAYFVVEPIDKTSCRIVTVITKDIGKNYVLPKISISQVEEPKRKHPLPKVNSTGKKHPSVIIILLHNPELFEVVEDRAYRREAADFSKIVLRHLFAVETNLRCYLFVVFFLRIVAE